MYCKQQPVPTGTGCFRLFERIGNHYDGGRRGFSLPSHFVLLKTAYGWISTEEFSGSGQRARLYFSENSDLAAVTFTTYAQNLRDM